MTTGNPDVDLIDLLDDMEREGFIRRFKNGDIQMTKKGKEHIVKVLGEDAKRG